MSIRIHLDSQCLFVAMEYLQSPLSNMQGGIGHQFEGHSWVKVDSDKANIGGGIAPSTFIQL